MVSRARFYVDHTYVGSVEAVSALVVACVAQRFLVGIRSGLVRDLDKKSEGVLRMTGYWVHA